nr:immunoglobulin light chain junction region [Macaca mulatta]
SMQGIQLPYTC